MIKNGEIKSKTKTVLSSVLTVILMAFALLNTKGCSSISKKDFHASAYQVGATTEDEKKYNENRGKYIALKNSVKAIDLTKEQAREMITKAEIEILKNDTIWKGIEDLLTVVKKGIWS